MVSEVEDGDHVAADRVLAFPDFCHRGDRRHEGVHVAIQFALVDGVDLELVLIVDIRRDINDVAHVPLYVLLALLSFPSCGAESGMCTH